MTTPTLETKNPGFGFYGTWATYSPTPSAAHMMFGFYRAALATAYDISEEKARDFLDSSHGRHLADYAIGSVRPALSIVRDVWVARAIRKFLASVES